MSEEEEYIAFITRRHQRAYLSRIESFMSHDYFVALDKADIFDFPPNIIGRIAPRRALVEARFIILSARLRDGKTEYYGWSKEGGWMAKNDPRVTEFGFSDIDGCLLPAVPDRKMTPPEFDIAPSYEREFHYKMDEILHGSR